MLNSLPPLTLPKEQLLQAYLHPASSSASEAQLELQELSTFLLARSYFDLHEYDRCSFVLERCRSAKAHFLRLYSRYIAGEKRKDEDSEMVLGPLDGAVTGNRELQGILVELEGIFHDRGLADLTEDDSWLLFLYGVVLAKQKNEAQAREILIKSVGLYPYNWAAWQELGATLSTLADVGHSPASLEYA